MGKVYHHGLLEYEDLCMLGYICVNEARFSVHISCMNEFREILFLWSKNKKS